MDSKKVKVRNPALYQAAQKEKILDEIAQLGGILPVGERPIGEGKLEELIRELMANKRVRLRSVRQFHNEAQGFKDVTIRWRVPLE